VYWLIRYVWSCDIKLFRLCRAPKLSAYSYAKQVNPLYINIKVKQNWLNKLKMLDLSSLTETVGNGLGAFHILILLSEPIPTHM